MQLEFRDAETASPPSCVWPMCAGRVHYAGVFEYDLQRRGTFNCIYGFHDFRNLMMIRNVFNFILNLNYIY